MRNVLYIQRAVRHWHRLPTGAVDAPSQELFSLRILHVFGQLFSSTVSWKNFQRRRLGGKRSRPCSEGAKSSRSGSPATGPARGLSLPAPSGQAAISAARPGSGRGGRRRSAPPHPERAARGQARHGPGEAGVAAMPGCRSPPAFSCSTFPHARFLKSPLLLLWGSRLRCRCGIPSPSCGCPVSLPARLPAALPARLPAPPALPVSSV